METTLESTCQFWSLRMVTCYSVRSCPFANGLYAVFATHFSTVRRYRPRAARGPDGFARDDLVNMPLTRVEELVAMLNSVEAGSVPWPKQLLTTFMCALTKGNGRQDVHHLQDVEWHSLPPGFEAP